MAKDFTIDEILKGFESEPLPQGLEQGSTTDELRQRLENDVSRVRSQALQSAEAIGVAPELERGKSSILPRAIRFKGQKIGQKQLEDFNKIMDESISRLTETAGFADEQRKSLFNRELRNRFGKLRLEALKAGINLDRQIQGGNLQESERQAILNALSGTAQGIGFAFTSQLSRGGQKSIESSLAGPQTNEQGVK